MTPEDLVGRCLSLPGAEETFPFGDGHAVLKVGGKMFAIVGLGDEPATISLKCDPALAVLLREAHAAVAPGYHLNKQHWNTVTWDGSLDDDLVDEWIEHSYELVVASLTRKARLLLGLDAT